MFYDFFTAESYIFPSFLFFFPFFPPSFSFPFFKPFDYLRNNIQAWGIIISQNHAELIKIKNFQRKTSLTHRNVERRWRSFTREKRCSWRACSCETCRSEGMGYGHLFHIILSLTLKKFSTLLTPMPVAQTCYGIGWKTAATVTAASVMISPWNIFVSLTMNHAF